MFLRPGLYTVFIAVVALVISPGLIPVCAAPVIPGPDASGHLFLGTPIADPPGIQPGTLTEVTFRAHVDTASNPPEVVFLDELDHLGNTLKMAVAELHDTGRQEDIEGNDLIYSGTFRIKRPASELMFRVRAVHAGKEVVSGTVSFLVTPFPQKVRPSDPYMLVRHPVHPSKVYSNEVLVKVAPGVSPDTIRKIARLIDGWVIGVTPPLRLYLIEFESNRTFKKTKDNIEIISRQKEVEYAMPNYKMVRTEIRFDSNSKCAATDFDCPNDGVGQWCLDKIKARPAWEKAGGGASSVRVAVIDSPVRCTHPDLYGRCTSDNNNPTNNHGTQVAGIIAAKANNRIGIAGIAWNTELELMEQEADLDIHEFKSLITTASSNVKIINISQKTHFDKGSPEHNLMKEAVCHVVNTGKLIVISGGQLKNETDEETMYPARLSDDKDHICDGPNSRRMVDQLLTVGATDKNDHRAEWVDETGYPCRSSDAKYLDIYAPGEEIRTITVGHNGAVTRSGTSYAAPMVSGAAAVLWAYKKGELDQKCDNDPKAISNHLKETADPINCSHGPCKRLNMERAMNTPFSSDSCPPPPIISPPLISPGRLSIPQMN